MPGGFARIIEGESILHVPIDSLTSAVPPTVPCFFNPLAKTNRDVSVGLTEVLGGRTFCDSLAGVGARGVRVANEASRSKSVTFVDFNPTALSLAKQNALENSLRDYEIVKSEANRYLMSRFRRDEKFDFVDVDPFGTPVHYLQGAFAAAADGAVVSVTATDTAVLCGVYPSVAYRRYSSVPLKNSFKHETAIRILVNACRRIAASGDAGIEPVAAHSTMHYIRVFLRLKVGARKADKSVRDEGFIVCCPRCGNVAVSSTSVGACDRCRSKVVPAGPLWVGPLVDADMVRSAALACRRKQLVDAARIFESNERMNDYPPYGFAIEDICATLKIPGVPFARVVEHLKSSGRKATRQPFEKTGIKTDANYDEVVDAVKAASSSPLHPMHA